MVIEYCNCKSIVTAIVRIFITSQPRQIKSKRDASRTQSTEQGMRRIATIALNSPPCGHSC
jgi:hypothetical protein